MRNKPEMAKFLGSEPQPPMECTGRVQSIWSLWRVGPRLYAGANPATLLVSDDDGHKWAAVDSWQPDVAGLTLPTIVFDPAAPDRLWLGITAAGAFASEDGSASRNRRNRL
jgi:hypothetical protein